MPLHNKLSLVEEEKEDANEADESMENRPERRHLESLKSISDIHDNGQVQITQSIDTLAMSELMNETEVKEEVVRDSEISGFASRKGPLNLAQRTKSE